MPFLISEEINSMNTKQLASTFRQFLSWVDFLIDSWAQSIDDEWAGLSMLERPANLVLFAGDDTWLNAYSGIWPPRLD